MDLNNGLLIKCTIWLGANRKHIGRKCRYWLQPSPSIPTVLTLVYIMAPKPKPPGMKVFIILKYLYLTYSPH